MGDEDNGRKRGKDYQVTCRKDTWTKLKGGRIEGGMWACVGVGELWGKMETTVLEQQSKNNEYIDK